MTSLQDASPTVNLASRGPGTESSIDLNQKQIEAVHRSKSGQSCPLCADIVAKVFLHW
jgi:hypothetical protein